jgi:dihydrofolate reductase
MPLVTADLAVSMDGVAAGHDQSAEHPMGAEVGFRLHNWLIEHADDHAAEFAAMHDAGAFVMGRHMFGPDRGEWDLDWTGWWGPNPSYQAPVFVLGHRPRQPVEMEGGTSFTFVTEGIETALKLAREAAGDRNVAIAGGPSTLNAYLRAGLVDELRLHVAPLVVGAGLRVFEGVAEQAYVPVASRTTPHVTHLTWRRARP